MVADRAASASAGAGGQVTAICTAVITGIVMRVDMSFTTHAAALVISTVGTPAPYTMVVICPLLVGHRITAGSFTKRAITDRAG